MISAFTIKQINARQLGLKNFGFIPISKSTTIPRPKQNNRKIHHVREYEDDDDYVMNIMAATEAPIRDTNKEHVFMPKFSFEPFYRVVLFYSNWEDDRDIAKTVKQCVPIISYSAAKQTVANAKAYGNSIVITALHEDAVKYCRNLLSKGLNVDLMEA